MAEDTDTGQVQAQALLNTFFGIVRSFREFLAVAIHTILFERNIYPESAFIAARKYNYPVHQCRHPKVCAWVEDAVAAVENQMLKGTVDRILMVIFSPSSEPLERVVFDISSFPSIPQQEMLLPFTMDGDDDARSEREEEMFQDDEYQDLGPLIDLQEQFRAVFARLPYRISSLKPLPKDCSFTICIELKEKAEPPVDHPQPWIPSEPQRSSNKGKPQSDLVKHTTLPVRTVAMGDFQFEVYIEEGKPKSPETTPT